MLEIYQLQQLIAIAENSTLTAAAEHLYISHSTMSRTMKKLEDELGVTLFERKKNKILLNENGKIAVKEARKVLKQLNTMKECVQSFDRSHRMIAVGSCAPAPIWNILPYLNYADPCMATFSEINTSENLGKGLLNGKYQLVIISDKPEDPRLYFEKYVEEQLSFLLPKGHPLARRKRLKFSDFNGETMLVYEEIGLWEQVYRRNLPDTNFIVEKDWASFQKLIDTSTLPVFITDLALLHFKIPAGKVPVTITDRDSAKSYYCCCLRSQKGKWIPFFDRIRNVSNE